MKETNNRSRRRFLKAGSILGLTAAFSPRTIAEAFTNSNLKTNQVANRMIQTSVRKVFDSTSLQLGGSLNN